MKHLLPWIKRAVLPIRLVWFIVFLTPTCAIGKAAVVSEVKNTSYSNERIVILRLSGVISDGDAEQVSKRVGRLRGGDRIAIELESPGGSYLEGVKLAKLFREKKIATVVRNDKHCMSACAIAFLGGARGFAYNSRMMRLIEPRAKVGFHAPYLELPPSDQHTSVEISDAFQISVKVMNEIAELAEHLHIHPRLIPRLMKPSRGDFYLISTAEDVALYGLELLMGGDDVERSIVDDGVTSLSRYAFTKSMAMNLCSNAFAWRANFPLGSARSSDEGLTLSYFEDIASELGTLPILASIRPRNGQQERQVWLSLPVGAAPGYSGHNFCNLSVRTSDPRRLLASEVECRSFQSRSYIADVEKRLAAGDLDGTPSESCYVGYRYGSYMAQRYSEQSEGRRIGPWWLVPAKTPLQQVESVLSIYLRDEAVLNAESLSAPICGRANKKSYYCL